MTQCITTLWRTVAFSCFGIAAASVLSGCGLSSLTSGFGSGIFGGSSSDAGANGGISEEQLLAAAQSDQQPPTAGLDTAAISAGCPKFVVWPQENTVTVYEPGREGDGLAIMHRGEITKTARECTIGAGQVTVKYGFSGRVLLGPRGQSGPVKFPVNVVVTDTHRQQIAGDRLEVATTLAVENPIGYFSAVRVISFNVPEGSRPGELEVRVGFDRKDDGADPNGKRPNAPLPTDNFGGA